MDIHGGPDYRITSGIAILNLRNLVRQAKPGQSRGMKGAHHVIAHLACSLGSGVRSNLGVEAFPWRRCEPQRKQTRFGLVTLLQVASLPDVMKPVTVGEVMGTSSPRACRGGWGQRVPND